MTIVRVGLGENSKYAAGYDAIFGKKKKTAAKKATAKARKSKTAKKK